MQPKRILNRDIIKYIAMLTMLLNHIGNIFMMKGTWPHIILTSIGYFTAPTMIYFMMEGYHYTRSRQKYFRRLALFAILSQIPYSFAFSKGKGIQINGLNMMFTLCICFLLIQEFDATYDRARRGVILFIAILTSAVCDWTVLAPIFTFFFLKYKEDVGQAVWRNSVVMAVFIFTSHIYESPIAITLGYTILGALGVFLSGVCIVYLYNGKRMERGKNFSKWFFYIFYPAHLFVLGLIRLFV